MVLFLHFFFAQVCVQGMKQIPYSGHAKTTDHVSTTGCYELNATLYPYKLEYHKRKNFRWGLIFVGKHPHEI